MARRHALACPALKVSSAAAPDVTNAELIQARLDEPMRGSYQERLTLIKHELHDTGRIAAFVTSGIGVSDGGEQ
jgi:hypothetical protein